MNEVKVNFGTWVVDPWVEGGLGLLEDYGYSDEAGAPPSLCLPEPIWVNKPLKLMSLSDTGPLTLGPAVYRVKTLKRYLYIGNVMYIILYAENEEVAIHNATKVIGGIGFTNWHKGDVN